MSKVPRGLAVSLSIVFVATGIAAAGESDVSSLPSGSLQKLINARADEILRNAGTTKPGRLPGSSVAPDVRDQVSDISRIQPVKTMTPGQIAEPSKGEKTEGRSTLSAVEGRAKRDTGRYIPTGWPLHGEIRSRFGQRVDPLTGENGLHMGVDIAARHGTPVRAPGKGMVIFASQEGGYGNLVIIDHGGGITTRHGHLSRFAVRPGQPIAKGEVIGHLGSTGKSTGPHLHYEIRVLDQPVDPSLHSLSSLNELATEIARSVGIPERLALALVTIESNWQVRARSPKGALGLGQILPRTAAGLGFTCDLFEPSCNLKASYKYLKEMLEIFGDARLAVAAYAAGPQVFERRFRSEVRTEIEKYVRNVIELANSM